MGDGTFIQRFELPERIAELLGIGPLAKAEQAGRVNRAENTEFEASPTRNTIVTAELLTATATRTTVKVLVGGTNIVEFGASVAATGISIHTATFVVPAGVKWKWQKVEGTVEANGFKTSYTIL